MEKTAALTSLRVTRTPDFYATLQVPFSNTMAGSLTMSCVYSKQPACQSEAWAFARCLFSVVIRHVRFSHSIWEIILVFLKSPAFLIIFFFLPLWWTIGPVPVWFLTWCLCGNNSREREKESGDRLGGEEGDNDGLAGSARCWLGEVVLRKGWEISTVNFVGSIYTASFVGSQGTQEPPPPRFPAWSSAASPLSSWQLRHRGWEVSFLCLCETWWIKRESRDLSQVWWGMPTIPAFGR